jgi:hypothetical protein|tara:strand:- start:1527 stop:1736 length:210 start_codon:yes stop_codon:yes gene_type:complete
MDVKSQQVGGDHYLKNNIQPWDIVDDHALCFYSGNAIKYILRDKGNKKEDLLKAIHYLQKMVNDLEGIK